MWERLLVALVWAMSGRQARPGRAGADARRGVNATSNVRRVAMKRIWEIGAAGRRSSLSLLDVRTIRRAHPRLRFGVRPRPPKRASVQPPPLKARPPPPRRGVGGPGRHRRAGSGIWCGLGRARRGFGSERPAPERPAQQQAQPRDEEPAGTRVAAASIASDGGKSTRQLLQLSSAQGQGIPGTSRRWPGTRSLPADATKLFTSSSTVSRGRLDGLRATL